MSWSYILKRENKKQNRYHIWYLEAVWPENQKSRFVFLLWMEPMALLSIRTYITWAASGICYLILFGANAESDFNKFFRLLFALLISRFDFNSDTRPSLGSPPFETLTYSKSKRPILLLSAFETEPNSPICCRHRHHVWRNRSRHSFGFQALDFPPGDAVDRPPHSAQIRRISPSAVVSQ